MSVKYRLKLPLALFVILQFLFICCDNPKSVLPKQLKLKKLSKEYIYSFNVYEYNVLNAAYNIENDINYKLNCNPNHRKTCEQIDWMNFEKIDSKEKNRITSILKETQIIESDYKGLIKLVERIENNETIYFGGCYKIMIGSGNQEFNFYEYAFFLDFELNRLYVLDYEEDFLF